MRLKMVEGEVVRGEGGWYIKSSRAKRDRLVWELFDENYKSQDRNFDLHWLISDHRELFPEYIKEIKESRMYKFEEFERLFGEREAVKR